MTTISAVLLAAGKSVRMGSPKALLDWHGLSLIRHQIDSLLQCDIEEIVVVLGHQSELLQPAIPTNDKVRIIVNENYHKGKTSSVKVGLQHIRTRFDGVMILGVDQPRQIKTFYRTMQGFAQSGKSFVRPGYQGKGGHPPIFSRRLVPELMGITEEKYGLREVIVRNRHESTLIDIDDPLILVNLNTKNSYRQALQLAIGS